MPCHGTCTYIFFRFVFLRLCCSRSIWCVCFGRKGNISKITPQLLLGPSLLSHILKETATSPLFGCVGLSFSPPSRLTCVPTIVTIVALFFSFDEFSTRWGGSCRLCRKPATTRNYPAPNEGYQACTSIAKAMKDAHVDQLLQRAVSVPARSSLTSNTALCALSRSKLLSARRFLAPKRCPRDSPSFRSLARAPIARSNVWPVHCSAVPPLRTLARALLRCFFVPSPCPCAVPSLRVLARAPLLRYTLPRLCFLLLSPCRYLALSRRASPLLSLLAPLSRYFSPCLLLVPTPRLCPPNRCLGHVKDLGYLFRLQESHAGLQRRLLGTALERQ